MGNIKRNTDPLKGPPDGVESEVKCVVVAFPTSKEKDDQVFDSHVMPCKIMCAYSGGTIGFSMREMNIMFSVRMDELFEVLRSAAEASQEFHASLPQKYTDAELETRWKELESIPFDEADSPSGLILAEKWYVFQMGTDRDDIWNWFANRHSKGLAYLMGMTEQ